MFHDYLDRFINFATTDEFSEEIIVAKKDFFSVVGAVFEDDESFENKMNAFTEWYCFDRVMEKHKKTPLQHFILINAPILNQEEKDIYNDFLKNIHSIFYTKRLKKDRVVIKDMCKSKKFAVSNNNSDLIFQKGDIFEGRIIPFKDQYFFSGAFCFHPNKLYRKIKKELKSRADYEKDKLDFIFLLSSMSLKLERSRQIDFKDIYTI